MLSRVKLRIIWSLFALGIFLSVLLALPVDAQRDNRPPAISTLQQSAQHYRAHGKTAKEIETLLEISGGYLNLGQFQAAIAELNRILDLNPDDSELLASTYKRLGDARSGLGNYKQAIASYQSSLENQITLSTLNNLVGLYRDRRGDNLIKVQSSRREEDARPYQISAKRDRADALKYARRALAESKTETEASAVVALINWHDLSQQLTDRQLKRGRTILETLPPSTSTVLLMLDWAKIDRVHQASWLYRASSNAQKLDDPGTISYVFLALGDFYRDRGNIEQAIDYAQLASISAEKSDTYESLFRAQRSLGQIYRQTGQPTRAKDAYRNAIASIDLVARDMGSRNTKTIVEFNRQIEPYYRETIDLLLAASDDTANLDEVLLIFDKLRLAQLRRYFGDNCFEIERPNLSDRDTPEKKNVASINSIILQDRVVFILQLSNGKTIKSEAQIPKSKLVASAQQWYRELTTGYSWDRTQSRFFYDLIIRPFEAELTATDPEALIFTHDGILRNLPMAALNDGEKFLAEKWASVSSLGLDYTEASTAPKDLEAIAFGRENFSNGWSQLPGVRSEINSISRLVDSKEFFGQKFTVDNLTSQLNQHEYSIVHLATHGYFGGTAETSFILAYDQKISAMKLEDILAGSKQIPDLLVLSACETAVGSELAQLGLAGVGARSGVATTLGSLWQVEDESQSETIRDFYTRLANNTNKLARPTAKSAIALQQIQIEKIRTLAHPMQWAALNLIGDW